MTHITGAIKADALAADVRSAPSLKPKLAVFHCSSFSGSTGGFRRVDRGVVLAEGFKVFGESLSLPLSSAGMVVGSHTSSTLKYSRLVDR
jgi:hypothetical protein